jgi:hypothetical protein
MEPLAEKGFDPFEISFDPVDINEFVLKRTGLERADLRMGIGLHDAFPPFGILFIFFLLEDEVKLPEPSRRALFR